MPFQRIWKEDQLNTNKNFWLTLEYQYQGNFNISKLLHHDKVAGYSYSVSCTLMTYEELFLKIFEIKESMHASRALKLSRSNRATFRQVKITLKGCTYRRQKK